MKQDKSDRKIIYISLIFIVLAAMYLMPSAALEQMLPEKVVRFRIAYPVAALALMGAYGSFFGQMGYFAAAHIILIWAFAEELWKVRKTLVGLAVTAALVFAFALVIPKVPEPWLQIGCGVYAVLITAMFGLSLMQRSPLFAIGAALFLISDMILSWNKFIGPVAAEKWLIMVPYYLGQLLIWLGATTLMKTGSGNDVKE